MKSYHWIHRNLVGILPAFTSRLTLSTEHPMSHTRRSILAAAGPHSHLLRSWVQAPRLP
jgi:hypothetical protein